MVDAAGALYVIGGYNGDSGTGYHDVWASTDGGARPDSVQAVVLGVMVGYCRGTRRGTRWVL